MRSCKFCRFSDDWKPINVPGMTHLEEGWCHRLPPEMGATGAVRFRLITSAFWCGEWRWNDPLRRLWRFVMRKA